MDIVLYLFALVLNLLFVYYDTFPIKLLNVAGAIMMMWCIWHWNRRRNNV